MVLALAAHHVDISHDTLGITDYTRTDDPRKPASPDCITISSIMTRDVASIDHVKTAHDAAKIMLEKKIGSIIVTAISSTLLSSTCMTIKSISCQ
ncbi:MAG TPA: hypothetical protein VFA69_04815 [Candidatus Nitrosotalea sp.]|nr:hypothetical protein [Candidatus Nitrosotalea sp.]